jgi:hypothetical protein
MYNKNPSLRSEGEAIEMTPEMIQEWIRCKEDIYYFAEKYYYLNTIDHGRILMKLRDYQYRLLNTINDKSDPAKRHTLVLSGRQSGKTEVSMLYMLHYILFNETKTVAILANNEKTASDILRKIKDSYESLPIWLQQGIKEAGWAQQKIQLENGCMVISGSTSSNGIRGRTISLLFLDEFAFVAPNVADEFIASVYPTIASGETSEIIMVSTPNGLNHFYNFWVNAQKSVDDGGNSFKPVKVNWDEVPKRDGDWKKQTIANVGLIKWNQEYECRFLGSAPTLVDPDKLEELGEKSIIDPKMLKYNGGLLIYEEPTDDDFYIMGVDSASGNGGDYSVIQILKIKDEYSIEQVAMFRSNTMSYAKFAEACIGISEYYNGAFMMVENNDIGAQVCSMIWDDFEYDLIVNTDKKGIGTRSTKKSKLDANMITKRYIENDWLIIRDAETLKEFAQYEEVTPNVFKGPRSGHDDCVTAMLWSIYFVTTPYFDGKDFNVKSIDKKFILKKKLEEDDAPIVMFDNGPTKTDAYGFNWDR